MDGVFHSITLKWGAITDDDDDDDDDEVLARAHRHHQ